MRSSTLPATPAALSLYLLGSWTLSKTLQYTRGGRSGTFLGEARFSPLSDAVLSYEETGKATLLPDNEQYEARHALLYDFSDNNDRGIVRVSFDEASDRSSVEGRVEAARFFHNIDFAQPDLPFQHPCGPDMYYGRLLCSSQDAFVLDWRVEGPRKLGRVVSKFSRRKQGKVAESAL